ncbi:MAG: hypothetical protein E7434_06200 [Ruminococcaceae bacterium]|nr:hypothetical protein [Oscillospiraceae bacterium]
MKKKYQKIRKGFALYVLGIRLERARGKLERLYSANEPNDSRKMDKARKRFNALCNQWNRLETLYKDL